MDKNIFKKTYEIDMDMVNKKPLIHWILAGNILPIVDKKADLKKLNVHTFSERGIQSMISKYPMISQIAGQKCASTVIEYMDKKQKPIILLYPTGNICIFSQNYESDMNPETYADLQQQLKLRQSWMQRIAKKK